MKSNNFTYNSKCLISLNFKCFLILVFLMCLPIQADWDDIKSKLISSSKVHSESKSDLEPESLLDSTSTWFVVKSKNVSAYSHNRNFSIYLKNSAIKSLNFHQIITLLHGVNKY